jgi:three-Cys-motif partner protein
MGQALEFDQIGEWSEIKLEIVRKYAVAYSSILSNQKLSGHLYIDGFAGAGEHVSRATGEPVPGSPLNALSVSPPFTEYHFVDLTRSKVDHLRDLCGDRPNVFIHEGDCNEVLLRHVLPRARYEDYRRALCLLDPYGLSLDWKILETCGSMKSVDIWLNFPIMDMNRNAFWRDPAGVDPVDVARMNSFWGDESWRGVVYKPLQTDMFGGGKPVKTATNQEIAHAFQRRLRDVAGFAHVPDPMRMRNSGGATVYYLFFASQKAVAASIVGDIFRKYGHRDRG